MPKYGTVITYIGIASLIYFSCKHERPVQQKEVKSILMKQSTDKKVDEPDSIDMKVSTSDSSDSAKKKLTFNFNPSLDSVKAYSNKTAKSKPEW